MCNFQCCQIPLKQGYTISSRLNRNFFLSARQLYNSIDLSGNQTFCCLSDGNCIVPFLFRLFHGLNGWYAGAWLRNTDHQYLVLIVYTISINFRVVRKYCRNHHFCFHRKIHFQILFNCRCGIVTGSRTQKIDFPNITFLKNLTKRITINCSVFKCGLQGTPLVLNITNHAWCLHNFLLFILLRFCKYLFYYSSFYTLYIHILLHYFDKINTFLVYLYIFLSVFSNIFHIQTSFSLLNVIYWLYV